MAMYVCLPVGFGKFCVNKSCAITDLQMSMMRNNRLTDVSVVQCRKNEPLGTL